MGLRTLLVKSDLDRPVPRRFTQSEFQEDMQNLVQCRRGNARSWFFPFLAPDPVQQLDLVRREAMGSVAQPVLYKTGQEHILQFEVIGAGFQVHDV